MNQGTSALALANKNNALAQFDPAKVDLIKRTVAKGTTNDELSMFLDLAGRYGLDPFLKEIWCIKRQKKNAQGRYEDDPNAPAVIMTSRDGYLKIAQQNPDFDGLKSFVVREGDLFEIDNANDSVVHKFGTKRGKILGAWAICYHKKRRPAMTYVDFAEYNQNSPIWQKFPSAMVQKVAEVFVLKRQFTLSGLVSQEELTSDFEAVSGEYLQMQNMQNNMSAPVPINSTPVNEPPVDTRSNADIKRDMASQREASPRTEQTQTNSNLEKQIQAVHNLAKRKGLSEMDFITLLDGATGKVSLDELNSVELSKVIQALNTYTITTTEKPASEQTIDLGGGVQISEDDLPF